MLTLAKLKPMDAMNWTQQPPVPPDLVRRFVPGYVLRPPCSSTPPTVSPADRINTLRLPYPRFGQRRRAAPCAALRAQRRPCADEEERLHGSLALDGKGRTLLEFEL